jgi:hypothetical protein
MQALVESCGATGSQDERVRWEAGTEPLLQQLIQEPALAFGGSAAAFFPGEKVLKGLFASFGELLWWREICAKLRDQLCAYPRGWHSQDSQRPLHQPLLDLHGFAGMHFARGLGGKVVDRDAARPTGAGREAASLEKTNRPQPFVDAGGGGRGGQEENEWPRVEATRGRQGNDTQQQGCSFITSSLAEDPRASSRQGATFHSAGDRLGRRT